jgi:archaellum component FlaC
MNNEFKKIIEEAKVSLEKAEEKLEDLSEEFAEDASEFWGDLKKRMGKVNDKLKDAYTEFEGESKLQAHLSMMEARDKLEVFKESAEGFAATVSKRTQEEMSMASLKAHLAKMDAKDTWEENKKELEATYARSKEEAEKLAQKAGEEIKAVFVKLTEMV